MAWGNKVKSVLPMGSPLVAVVEAVGTAKEEGFSVRIFLLPRSDMLQVEVAMVHVWHETQGQAW